MPEYWEEAWLSSATWIHESHCKCGNWRNHLWTLCALDDADLAAAADITERGVGDGDVDMGDVGDGLPGDVGGSVASTSLQQESAIPALITHPILCRSQEVLHTPCSPEKVVSPPKLELPVSLYPRSEPSVQLHQKRSPKVRFSVGKKRRKERKPRKPRVRAPLRVPKALLREMDRLRMRQEDKDDGGISEDSEYFSSDSLTDPWTTSDEDFQSDPDPLHNKRKKRLQF
uniref:ORF2/2 n=2 Tax=Torque teno sus virus 1b TaxID=687387 RepID=A0A385FPQ5_9VIRU|nr:ORF2/2 [Torque teno sus virus 1b]